MSSKFIRLFFQISVVIFPLFGCSGGDALNIEPIPSIQEPTNPPSDPTLSPLYFLPEHTPVIPTSMPDIVSTPGSILGNIVNIRVVDNAYIDHTVTIRVGTVVVWNFDGNTGESHSVTSNDDIFTSELLSSGSTYTFTFNEPGTFPYFCVIHNGSMDGLIIVIED